MSLLNFLKNPIGEINAWFKKEEASVEKLLKKIAPYVQEAEDLATKLETYVGDLASLSQNDRVAKVAAWIGVFVKDAALVEAFATANAGALIPNLLNNAVVFVLAHTHNVVLTEALHILQAAVQLVFSTLKVSTDSATGSTVSALTTK